MLLIIKGNLNRKRSRHSTARTKRRLVPGRRTAKPAREAANGNSAFGHKQGDAATRTTGSQNNAHGKAESADAHASHVKKATLSDGHAAHTKSKSHANEMATVHHTSQHPQIVSHQPKGAPTHTKGQAAQPNKKKKSQNEGPGGGH